MATVTSQRRVEQLAQLAVLGVLVGFDSFGGLGFSSNNYTFAQKLQVFLRMYMDARNKINHLNRGPWCCLFVVVWFVC